ncbi:uncharacterized protein ppp1r3aa isoform X2 [Synchiropus splendidus]|uniref:uncharacterized protein ppp1r3aa isoform X2 n=1 Tax=Synchiropus splendidus TaxID=270530 RepID=UPI00237E2FE4|nr:uncharacterized protein ppp1r3aa isoform X2 [Synchiropus splendidus]
MTKREPTTSAVELRKRRQRAARLAHVKDMLSEKKGEKKCDLRALRSQSKVDKPSEILTYHQIPLLTLEWGDEAKHWDVSKSAAIIAEQSKVAMNDTQLEHDQKGRNASEETPVCDVWRAFLNRPSDGDESITRESEWLQLATSVTPLKKSVISQQLKTDDVAFEGENSSTNSKDFLLVEPNTGSLSGEMSEQGNTHEGSFENMKLGNQAQDISEANILVSSENGVTPASTQVDLSSNDKAIHEICPSNLFLLEKKGIVTYQDEAIAVPRQTDKFKTGSTNENQPAEFRPIRNIEAKIESEENSQTSTHKESAQRESDSKGRYPAVDKHLDIKQVALQRAYFKTKTATDVGADAIQRIDEKQGDSWLKCEVDDSNKRLGDFNWSGVCQEEHGSHKSQSELLEKLREVMREDMRGSTMMSTDMIPKTLKGADTNTRSKDDTFGKMKVVREEIGSVVRGPCETEMKEIFTEAISDKMLVDRFVENVIKGVWDEVFSEKALEKEQVLKCEAFKSPPAEKRLFKSAEVLEKRWSLSEEEMKSQNEGVSRNASAGHQPEILDTSRVVIQTVAGEAEGVRPLSERKDTPVHTIVEDIGSSEKRSLKRGPDSTDAAPQESFIEHFVEILIRGIWEEVFSQMATNLKMIDRKDTVLHHRQELRPLRCNDSTVVQETDRNLSAPVVNQSRGKNDKDSETQQHMTDDPNCKQTELQCLLEEDLVVLTESVLSCQMISSSNCDEFSMTDERVTSTGVEPDTFPQKLQSHLSLRAHLSQDFNTSLASRSRTTRNVVGRGSVVTDTSRGLHDQSSFQQIPHSERDKSLTTNEAGGDPKLREFKPIDSLSDSLLGFNPATKTSSSYEDHTLFKERPINFQTDLDSTESPPHQCPPSKRSKECDGLVWWSVLYILSHVTKLLTTGLFVAAFFVFVLIYDFPVFFALYVFSTCWCLYKWRAGTNSADKSRS